MWGGQGKLVLEEEQCLDCMFMPISTCVCVCASGCLHVGVFSLPVCVSAYPVHVQVCVCVCARVCVSARIPLPMHTRALVLVCSRWERPCPLPQAVELPDSFSPELRSLLEGLLQRDVNRRLGCMGRG